MLLFYNSLSSYEILRFSLEHYPLWCAYDKLLGLLGANHRIFVLWSECGLMRDGQGFNARCRRLHAVPHKTTWNEMTLTISFREWRVRFPMLRVLAVVPRVNFLHQLQTPEGSENWRKAHEDSSRLWTHDCCQRGFQKVLSSSYNLSRQLPHFYHQSWTSAFSQTWLHT